MRLKRVVPTSGVAGGKSFHTENPLLFLGHFSRAKLVSKSNWYPLTLHLTDTPNLQLPVKGCLEPLVFQQGNPKYSLCFCTSEGPNCPLKTTERNLTPPYC